MRIRTIKPEFYTHEVLFELEHETGMPIRIAFTGLWCIADREGRFKWQPRRIGAQILPYDGVDFSRVLDALLTRGLIQKYESEGEFFGFIPTFNKHQVINNRERESELPNPSESSICDASGTRGARVGHAGKAEGKGMEGKGTDYLSDESDFEDFWKAFPATSRTRSTKHKLKEALKKSKNTPPLRELTQSVTNWSKCDQWTKDGGQYAPGAHLFVKDRKWEDEPEAMGQLAKDYSQLKDGTRIDGGMVVAGKLIKTRS